MLSSAPSPHDSDADLSALRIPSIASVERASLDSFLGLRSCAIDAYRRVPNEESRLIYLPWSHTARYYQARADTVAALLDQHEGVKEVLLLEEQHGLPQGLKDVLAEIIEWGATEEGKEEFLRMSLIPDEKKRSYSPLFAHYREKGIAFHLQFIDTAEHNSLTSEKTAGRRAMNSFMYLDELTKMFFESPSEEMLKFVQRKGLTPFEQALELQGRRRDALAAVLSAERNETMRKQVNDARARTPGSTPILVSTGAAHICIARDTVDEPNTAVTFIDLPEVFLRELPEGVRHHGGPALMLVASIARVENESLFQEEERSLFFAYMIECALKGPESKDKRTPLTPLQASFNAGEVQGMLARTLALMTAPEERDQILSEWEKQIAVLSPKEGFGKPIKAIIDTWLEAKLGSKDNYTHCERILETYLRVRDSSQDR